MKLINYNRPFPNNFSRFFDDQRTMANDAYRPAVNITETDELFEIELLAPGRVKENFNIAFNEEVLEITYTTPTTEEGVKAKFRLKEFRLADFTRRFRLDAKMIKDEAIDASYIDGVLRLTLPKREEALPKAPRQIAVG